MRLKNQLLITCLLSGLALSGCATNTAMLAGCDFVAGAATQDQLQRENKTEGNRKDSVAFGVFNMVFGLLVRPFSNDNRCYP